jgi:hypothetical protein
MFKDPTGHHCVYSQSSGVMCCKDDNTQKVYYHEVGYSGYDPGKNDPDWQDSPFTGPIPRGTWIVGPGASNATYRFFRTLTPVYPNDCGGAGRQCLTFLIHGDNRRYPGKSSEGCIVLPDSGRGIHTGETLEVVR